MKTEVRIAQRWLCLLTTAIAMAVATVSFFADDEGGRAYQFPRLMGGVLLAMAVVDAFATLGKSAYKSFDIGAGRRLFPGLLMVVGYVWVAEYAGFYLSSWIFFTVAALYYRGLMVPLRANNRGAATVVVGAVTGFMAVVYLLFTALLRVQIPTGPF